MQFSELQLSNAVLRATEKLGYQTATPIQAKAIPAVLSGGDLIACAQTGTGKTAAFTLPLLDRLAATAPTPAPRPQNGKRKHHRGPVGPIRALILAPTRELACQIGESLTKYGQFTRQRHTVVYGGVSQFHQVKALQRGVDTLVATPGRLMDLMQQGHIKLANVEVFILDEADQMLDMGFMPAIKRIVSALPKQRQTLMFSATMPDAIRKLAQEWLTKPASIEVARVATPAERIDQSVHFVDKKRKPELLVHLLNQARGSRTLVFSRTKHGADKLVKRLSREGLNAEAIHGNKSQNARNRAIAKFKSKNPPVLVATDIAARGLDISGVTHVVNFDLPEVPETYVHRIGRTARAGAEGIAISFCSAEERNLLRQVEKLTRRAVNAEPIIDGLTIEKPTGGPAGARGGSRSGYKTKKSGRYQSSKNGHTAKKGSSSRSGYASGKPSGHASGSTAGGPGGSGSGKPKRKRRPRPARPAK